MQAWMSARALLTTVFSVVGAPSQDLAASMFVVLPPTVEDYLGQYGELPVELQISRNAEFSRALELYERAIKAKNPVRVAKLVRDLDGLLRTAPLVS